MVHPVIPEAAEHPNLLNGLVTKRASLAGEIEFAQAELRKLISALDSVEATIRVFDPDIDLDQVRPRPVPPRHAAFKGEVTRVVFDSLRSANAPLTSRDIAVRLMTWRGLDPENTGLLVLMTKRIGSCLRAKKEQGLVRSLRDDGPLIKWEIHK